MDRWFGFNDGLKGFRGLDACSAESSALLPRRHLRMLATLLPPGDEAETFNLHFHILAALSRVPN